LARPGFKSWSTEVLIGSIRRPILAILGRDDQADHGVGNGARVALYVEILEDCGHSPHLDQSDCTLAIPSDFLARIDISEQAEERRHEA